MIYLYSNNDDYEYNDEYNDDNNYDNNDDDNNNTHLHLDNQQDQYQQ